MAIEQEPGSLRGSGGLALVTDQDIQRAVDALERTHDVRDAPALRRYLVSNPDLLPVLTGITDRVARRFPGGSPLVLEVVEGFEDVDSPVLFVLVPTTLGPLDAQAALAAFDRDWPVDEYRRVAGRLNVDVEFR